MSDLIKDLFVDLSDLLEYRNREEWDQAWKQIDMDKGQLDTDERPAVAFPCALIKVGMVPTYQADDLTLWTATVQVRLAFDTVADRTSASAPEAAREQSLAYLTKSGQVFNYLKGAEPSLLWDSLLPAGYVQEERSDGLVVMRLTYTCNRFE